MRRTGTIFGWQAPLAARALAALLAAALLALIPAPRAARSQTPTTPAPMKQTRQITLLALGDSLTAGYGLPADAALPAVIQDMLTAAGYNVRIVNAGVSGDTSAGGLARLPWLLEDAPHCAWLELGANDGLMGRDPEAMEANLDAMLAMFEARDIPVLFIGMKAIANYGEEYTAAFDAVFPRLAAKHEPLFYPFLLQGVALDPKLNQLDGIHPNKEGVRVIADALYPYVRELVEHTLAR